jgi:fimbrial isopeptide formation D2 family protein/uncharacterized repeat protein (TIGR01451 family)
MTKIITKILNNNIKTLVVVGLVLSATAVSTFAVSATGPQFNVFPISYTQELNHDFPLLDGRNVTNGEDWSVSDTDHANGVEADPGDEIEFLVYYHNGAADAPENIARNVVIKASVPSGDSTSHTVSASISADNAETVRSADKGGNVTVHLSESQDLTYVSGSTRWFPERSTSGQSLPNGILLNGIDLGDVRGCWDFAGFVKFKVRVGEDIVEPQEGRLEIEKEVRSNSGSVSFNESVNAEPGDIVEFSVKVTARDGKVYDVIIRDIIPSGLIEDDNSIKINGSHISSTSLFGSGYNYGDLFEGDTVTVTFEAEVASSSFFGSGTRTITNTANARGKDVSTVQDTADVRVIVKDEETTFIRSKSAYNQTQGINAQSVQANEGDIITYTLSVENTGNAELQDFVIEDDLSDILNHADVVNLGGGQMSGDVIRFDEVDIQDGIEISKTFQVRVRAIPASGDLVMTNFFGNQIDVHLRPPFKGVPPKAPPSGIEDWIAPLMAAVTTGSILLFRKREIFSI